MTGEYTPDPGGKPAVTGPIEGPGTLIGPYKLVRQIGEGGMGAVYVAEQTRPVQRVVALKIIKPGMDSRQVIARFEAERQALALMDHPKIARVLDAGTTESGRPYFVIELVKGVPITTSETSAVSRPGRVWGCSSRFVRRCGTRTRRASSTATSSRPT
jgi:serine/threonine protein kinase